MGAASTICLRARFAPCVAACKYSLQVVREWGRERVQWGRPIGEHGAVAQKIAFIAATTFAMEAVLEWTGSPELQDDMTMLIASRNGT